MSVDDLFNDDFSLGPPGGGLVEGLALDTAEEVTGEFDPPAPETRALATAADTLDRLQRTLQHHEDTLAGPPVPGAPSPAAPHADPRITALEVQLQNQVVETQRANERANAETQERLRIQGMLASIQSAADALLRREQEARSTEESAGQQMQQAMAHIEHLEKESQELQLQLQGAADELELRNLAISDLEAQVAGAATASAPTADAEQEMAMARQIISGLEEECARAETKLGNYRSELLRRTAQGEDLEARASALRQQIIELGHQPAEIQRRPATPTRGRAARRRDN